MQKLSDLVTPPSSFVKHFFKKKFVICTAYVKSIINNRDKMINPSTASYWLLQKNAYISIIDRPGVAGAVLQTAS